MTSEQQINNVFGKTNIYAYSVGQMNGKGETRLLFIVKVYVVENWYCIGIGTSRYKSFTDALIKIGGKRIIGNGKHQKNNYAG